MSPRKSRRGCATAAEFRKSVEFVSIPAVRRALRDAGMTPLFARIAIRLSVAPSASIRIPARRRFATTKTAGERVRRDVEDPMEPRAPAREHGEDRDLERERRRRSPGRTAGAPGRGPTRLPPAGRTVTTLRMTTASRNTGGLPLTCGLDLGDSTSVSTGTATPCCEIRRRPQVWAPEVPKSWSHTARTAPVEGDHSQ